MPKVLTLLNEKGGVGKTTLAVHIAAGLAMDGLRVALIDADSQGSATISLNMQKQPLLHDLLVRGLPWADCLQKVPDDRVAAKVKGELLLVPSNIETRVIPMLINDAFTVADRLAEIEGIIDVVVFDTPPTPSLLHGAIYMATDYIIYPTIPAALAIDGLRESLGHRAAASNERNRYGLEDVKIGGIIPTMYQTGHNAHDFGLSVLTKQFKNAVWGPLPIRTGWQKAQFARKTVWAWDAADDAAIHAWDVVNRVETLIGVH